MKQYIRALIPLYATHTVDEIENNGDLLLGAVKEDDYEKLCNDIAFTQTKDLIRELKEDLEHLERYPSQAFDSKTQIVRCLKLILDKALHNKYDATNYELRMDMLYQLIVTKYYNENNWNEKERGHFEFLYPKIAHWNICFFSYTNQGAYALNNRYKECIKELIYQNTSNINLSDEDWQKSNLVAEVIIQRLLTHNLKRMFYDKSDIKTGDPLSEKIKDELDRSLLFIQLITDGVFAYSANNWPFDEYTIFYSNNNTLRIDNPNYNTAFKKAFFFVIGGKDLKETKPASFPNDYERWYTHIGDVRHESAQSAPTAPNKSQEFTQAIDNVAVSIMKFLEDDLISNIPS